MKSRKNIPADISRREFLKLTTAGAAIVIGSQPGLLWADPMSANNIKIGVQLYSVRNDCAKDFDNAMEQVAKMGFEGVEFAGYYKYAKDPKGLRKHLDSLGIKAAGTHIGVSNLKGDSLKKTIDFHKIIGCKYLIVPSGKDITDPEKNQAFAETFNQAAATLKEYDMFCGFHNHVAEFEKHQDKTYWDIFAERTTKDVVLQLDVGWAVTAGIDPVNEFRKHAGRSKTAHFKPAVLKGDEGKKAILGQDSVNWKAVIKACADFGGTEWFIIEQEQYPDGKSPMECTHLSLQGLKKIL